METGVIKGDLYEETIYEYVVNGEKTKRDTPTRAMYEEFDGEMIAEFELRYIKKQPSSIRELAISRNVSVATYKNYYRGYRKLRTRGVITEEHVKTFLPPVSQISNEPNLRLIQVEQEKQEIELEVNTLKTQLKELEQKSTHTNNLLLQKNVQLEAENTTYKKLLDNKAKANLDAVNLEPLTKQLTTMQLEIMKLNSLKHLPDTVEKLGENYFKVNELRAGVQEALFNRQDILESIRVVHSQINKLDREGNEEYLDEINRHLEYQYKSLSDMFKQLLNYM